MPQITLKDWRLAASVEDSDILRLEVEATDGSDVVLVSEALPRARRDNEPFVMHFTTERLEAEQNAPRRAAEAEGGEADEEPEWLAEDEETLYTRGWEINVLVDEDGLLAVEVERQDDAEIYELDPAESGIPTPSPFLIRLAAEEEIDDEEDEDEDEDNEEEDEADDLEDLDYQDQLDEFDDYDEFDDLDEAEDDMDGGDLFEEDERY